MIPDNPHSAEPPPEAYSRSTNPGRFRPLHQVAIDLVEHLVEQFDVSRDEAFDLPPDFEGVKHARAPVRLTPATPAAAPIAVMFTTFPGLVVRCGRGFVEAFPWCGCDACHETADGEGERLRSTIGDVVAGRFREQITIPMVGDATLEWELGRPDAPTGYRRGGAHVRRAQARAAFGEGSRIVEWQPWPTRPHRPSHGARRRRAAE